MLLPFSSPAFVSLILERHLWVTYFYVCLVLSLCSGRKILASNSANAVSDKRKRTESPSHCSRKCLLIQPRRLPTLCLPAELTRLAHRGEHLVAPVAIHAIPFPAAGPHRAQLSAALSLPVFPQATRSPPARHLLPSSLCLRRWH